CMRNAHLEMPFHRIQKWTGQYFRPGSLWKVGVCVIIDHGNTDRMDPDQNPYVLFVHMNGLHSLPYIQCGCGGLQE
ncbi:hypothetical protein BDN71DRAFT_1361608, partial [Pleurotus eryngii]